MAATEEQKDVAEVASEVAATGNTTAKEKIKKRGVISRMWNRLFRVHGDDFEKRLQHISKEEAAVLARMKKRATGWRRMARNLIVFSVLFELLNSGKLDMDHLGNILEYAMVTLQKLSAPANEDEMKVSHLNLLKELGHICQSGEDSKNSHVMALIKGLRFVLENIQAESITEGKGLFS